MKVKKDEGKNIIRRDIGEISATISSGKSGETLMNVLDHSHDFCLKSCQIFDWKSDGKMTGKSGLF
jgi:hypothetical protein